MRALGAVGVLAVALLFCATPKPPPQAAPSTPSSPMESCPTGPVAAIGAELFVDAGVGGAGSVQPEFTREPFAPPSEPGKWRFLATGCLAAPEATEAQGERYPPRAFRAEAEAVRFIPVGTGVIVEHDLTHACCLSGNVVARVDGKVISLTETLTGNPCRCLCESTLRTAIGLPGGGQYELVVRVAEPGGEREAFRGPVAIP